MGLAVVSPGRVLRTVSIGGVPFASLVSFARFVLSSRHASYCRCPAGWPCCSIRSRRCSRRNLASTWSGVMSSSSFRHRVRVSPAPLRRHPHLFIACILGVMPTSPSHSFARLFLAAHISVAIPAISAADWETSFRMPAGRFASFSSFRTARAGTRPRALHVVSHPSYASSTSHRAVSHASASPALRHFSRSIFRMSALSFSPAGQPVNTCVAVSTGLSSQHLHLPPSRWVPYTCSSGLFGVLAFLCSTL